MNTATGRITIAIAPTSRGFGYAVFEQKDALLDWGVKEARTNKTRDSLLKLRVLMHLLQPAVMVVENTQDPRSRRSKRVSDLIEKMARLAKEKSVPVVRYPRNDVLAIFHRVGARNKDDIAAAIAKKLPELAPRVPPRRRIWESEHYNMAIFEAAALGLTYFARSEAQGRPNAPS